MAERLHKRLYVALPVCPEPSCNRVGKMPINNSGNSMREYCTGPIERRHPKRKLEPRLFVESRAKIKETA